MKWRMPARWWNVLGLALSVLAAALLLGHDEMGYLAFLWLTVFIPLFALIAAFHHLRTRALLDQPLYYTKPKDPSEDY